MAGLLADGLNLGLTRMAEACSIASLSQLAWTADWHIREETYLMALRCLVNQQQREPFAANFGPGTASSSDGQFFQAAGFGRDAARLNAHYSQRCWWLWKSAQIWWRGECLSWIGLPAGGVRLVRMEPIIMPWRLLG